ncbi:MAG: DUF3108 domain-containing protein [Bacteroidota bacterium]|nr:DUF3108 domain-containing protein [Bacteroidota bacterium]
MYLIQHFILFLIFFPGAIAQLNTGDSIQPNRIVIDQKVNDAFQDGEWFRFRMRYGFLNASYAIATVRETTFKDQAVYHVAATGKTTGFARWFFKVDDYFDSYFEKDIVRPIRFVRNISEGNYKRHVEIDFDHNNQSGIMHDLLRKTKTEISFAPNLQDLVSTFYFLRNHFDLEGIQVGETASLHMIYDKKPFAFQFRFLGYENVKTKFGVVPCVKFRPYVKEGRIFKKEGGLSLWVSNDNNRIPIKVVAELSVGSLEVDLVDFKGLKHPFNIIVNE